MNMHVICYLSYSHNVTMIDDK